MSNDFDVVLVLADEAASTSTQPLAGGKPRISGLVYQTWRDAWTYCKATKKAVARYQWLPRLSAATAVLSALTATAVFATLQNDDSTLARIAVAAVAMFTAGVTALQAWTASRIKALNDQARRFHELHRSVQQDLETRKDLSTPDYAAKIERDLNQITAGMSEPSNRDWREAKKEMRRDIREMCPELSARR